jgi:choice-of-anchor A domain-containing protein
VLKNSSDFHGTIYSPNADVEMKNSADFYGAVIAESFVQHNSAEFNYDASLRDVDTTDWGVYFIVENWSEE